MKKSVYVLFLAVLILGSSVTSFAGWGNVFTNGNFESGNLNYWSWNGDVGIDSGQFENVISGSYTAYLTTDDTESNFSGNYAVGGICSYLQNGVMPTYVPKKVNVSFKVRYKTNECIFYNNWYEDPFTATLATGSGSVLLAAIESDGVTNGPYSKIKNTVTNTFLVPPVLPPTIASPVMFCDETPTLLVTSSMPYSSCDLVRIKFQICDSWYDNGMSAAFIDDVAITFDNQLFGGGVSNSGTPATGSPQLCPTPN